KIFKFGGASVKNAEGVKNLANILKKHAGKTIVVVSAMGKTTNALEEVARQYFSGDGNIPETIDQIRKTHLDICSSLFDFNDRIFQDLEAIFQKLENKIREEHSLDYDFEYDQIVSLGELISTKIVNAYLCKEGIASKWIDIRNYLRTDDTFREALIDWELSGELIPKAFTFSDVDVYITQGFIGSTISNLTTTLGREGSDYTAAILANLLNAECVVIWKDVPGILNADPQYFEATQKLEEISYQEAIELSYSGAKVIHPKTIKPLENKRIPLYVNSFIDPDANGTVIHYINHKMELVPVFIMKKNQVLLTITPKDFSFVMEDSLSKIFGLLASLRIKANIVQHSALNFSIAIDMPERGVEPLVKKIEKEFDIRYNTDLDLITIRHYDEEAIDKITNERNIFVEQKTRTTARFLVR
ncbi:MAG: aspartate kinase, partial [Bacteroidota bacterium]|nr:aspartate kinase [Bacteroidota bacterium]